MRAVICRADTVSSCDPVWTCLHHTFHSISHTTLFILHDMDMHDSNLSKDWSVARGFTVCAVLNMVPHALSVYKGRDSLTQNEQQQFLQCLKDPVSTYFEMKRQKMRERQQKHSW